MIIKRDPGPKSWSPGAILVFEAVALAPLSQSDRLEAEVGRKRDCIVDLDVDALRQSSSDMSGPNVKAPFGVRVPRYSDRIDKVRRKVSGRYIFDVARFLVNLSRWRNQDCLLDRYRKSETSEGSCLPVKGVPAVAVLLSIGAANAASAQERELLSEGK